MKQKMIKPWKHLQNELLIIIFLLILTFFSKPALSMEMPINLSYIENQKTQFTASSGQKFTIWGESLKTETQADLALLFLEDYLKNQNEKSREYAKNLLNLFVNVQSKNGLYPSGLSDDTENVNGIDVETMNSTARCTWALGYGLKIFNDEDKKLSEELIKSLKKTEKYLSEMLENPQTGYGKYLDNNNFSLPLWLPAKRADIASHFVIGLCYYYETQENKETKKIITCYCDGICKMQKGSQEDYPFYAHLTTLYNVGLWFSENSRQIRALCQAGTLLGNSEWIESAEREANFFLIHLISSFGPIYGFAPGPIITPQYSSSAETITTNLIYLYETTNKENYAVMAGVCASWFMGNNHLNKYIYNPKDGSCLKGITKEQLLEDDGLESSISAARTFLGINKTPAQNYLDYKEIESIPFIILSAEEGIPVYEKPEFMDNPHLPFNFPDARKLAVIEPKQIYWDKFNLTEITPFTLYGIFVKFPSYERSVAVNVRLDGYKVYVVPMGGASEQPYFTMEKVIDYFQLSSGLHTFGVKFGGMNFTNPAIVDCFVLQPLIEKRVLISSKGKYLAIFKSFCSQKYKYILPIHANETKELVVKAYYSGKMEEEIKETVNLAREVDIPVYAYGYTIVTW